MDSVIGVLSGGGNLQEASSDLLSEIGVSREEAEQWAARLNDLRRREAVLLEVSAEFCKWRRETARRPEWPLNMKEAPKFGVDPDGDFVERATLNEANRLRKLIRLAESCSAALRIEAASIEGDRGEVWDCVSDALRYKGHGSDGKRLWAAHVTFVARRRGMTLAEAESAVGPLRDDLYQIRYERLVGMPVKA